jgi:Mesaconyl-CoA hydratase
MSMRWWRFAATPAVAALREAAGATDAAGSASTWRLPDRRARWSSCGLKIPERKTSARSPIAARVSRLRRSASASAASAVAAGASDGSFSRDQSSVSVAAITVQAAQWPSCPHVRSARAGSIARTNAAISPGDELRVECEVIEVRPSKSRPEEGLMKLRTTTLNQDDEAVLVYLVNMVVQRRKDIRK